MKYDDNVERLQEIFFDRSSGEPYEVVVARKLWNGIDHFCFKM